LRHSWRQRLSSWGKIAELLFFPSFCELCRALLENPGERVICRLCLAKIRPCPAPFCLACGRFFEGAGSPHLCLECLRGNSPLIKHRSFARYEGVVKDVILLFKYRSFEILGTFLGDLLAGTLGHEEDLWEGVGAIIPVPLHPIKRKKRGFNQAQVLAARLARSKKIKLLDRHLFKLKDVPPQTTLEAEEREKNVRGVFDVRRGQELKGKTVLLVDDVYTTGATLRECSRVLKKAGAREVRAVTVARA